MKDGNPESWREAVTGRDLTDESFLNALHRVILNAAVAENGGSLELSDASYRENLELSQRHPETVLKMKLLPTGILLYLQ